MNLQEMSPESLTNIALSALAFGGLLLYCARSFYKRIVAQFIPQKRELNFLCDNCSNTTYDSSPLTLENGYILCANCYSAHAIPKSIWYSYGVVTNSKGLKFKIVGIRK